VTFDVFVRAALLRMQGAGVVSRPVMDVELLDAMTNRSGRRNHLPARIHSRDGRLVAARVPTAGSGLSMESWVRNNCMN
jgi:molybdopterin molybdotransferase